LGGGAPSASGAIGTAAVVSNAESITQEKPRPFQVKFESLEEGLTKYKVNKAGAGHHPLQSGGQPAQDMLSPEVRRGKSSQGTLEGEGEYHSKKSAQMNTDAPNADKASPIDGQDLSAPNMDHASLPKPGDREHAAERPVILDRADQEDDKLVIENQEEEKVRQFVFYKHN